MARIVDVVRARGGFTLVDEIYLGLSFDDRYGHSALVARPGPRRRRDLDQQLLEILQHDRLAARLAGAAAGAGAGGRDSWRRTSTSARRRSPSMPRWPASKPSRSPSTNVGAANSARRRDFLVPALEALGLPVPVMPDGAFYAWADCSRYADPGLGGSWDFAFELMQRAHLAITPGRDFGRHDTARFVRLLVRQLARAAARGGRAARRRCCRRWCAADRRRHEPDDRFPLAPARLLGRHRRRRRRLLRQLPQVLRTCAHRMAARGRLLPAAAARANAA